MVALGVLALVASLVGTATPAVEETERTSVPAAEPVSEPAPDAQGMDPADLGADQEGFDLEPPSLAPEAELDVAPAAICRMAPQCDTDADCDAICGAGQGQCKRSRCPIRVCRCG